MVLELAIKAWVLIGCLIGASAPFGWPLEVPSEFKPGFLPFSLGCLAIAYFTLAPVRWLPTRWTSDATFRRLGSLLLSVYVVVAFFDADKGARRLGGMDVVQLVFMALSLLWPIALIYFGLSVRWWLSEPVSLAIRLGRALLPFGLLAVLAKALPAYLALVLAATPLGLWVFRKQA